MKPGTIRTVTGPIDPDDAGIVLPHEHIFSDSASSSFEPPDAATERALAEEPVSLENRWFVTGQPYSNRDNLRLVSFEDAVAELQRFQQAGGATVVDVTPKRTGSDPAAVRRVARHTGLNIVHGTAYYTRDSHPDHVATASVADLAAEFEADVRSGIGDTDVPAGLVGEVGITGRSSDEGAYEFIHPDEEKVLRAGARAARRTGVPLSVHPPSYRSTEWPTSRRCHQVLDVVEEEGLPLERVVLCHRDQSKWLEADLTYQRELADRGAYIEFDLFGHWDAYIPEFDDAQASDADRAKWVSELVAEDYHQNLLLSHDIYMKVFLTKYGGHGYDHILRRMVPLFKELGVEQPAIDTMLIENPRELLTVASTG